MKKILLLVFFYNFVYSNSLLLDNRKITKISLQPYTSVYFDNSLNKTIEQVKNIDFIKIKQNNFKAQKHHIWSQFTIVNKGIKNKEIYLENNKSGIDILDIFIYKNNKFYKKIELGDMRDINKRELHSRKSALVLNMDLNSKYDFYIMHKSYSSISTLWTIQSRQYFEDTRSIENIIWGFFSGIIMILCLYNLGLFVVTIEYAFISYIFMSLSLLIYQLCVHGVIYQFIGDVNLQYLNNMTWFFGFLVLFFSVLFPMLFFKPAKETYMYKFLFIMLLIYGAISVLYTFSFKYPELRYLTKYTDLIIFLLIPTLVITSIWAAKNKLTGAYLYLFGQVFYLSLVVYVAMAMIGYFKVFDYIWMILPIGITIDAIFLILALLIKIKEIKKKKQENEMLIISQARFTTMGQNIAHLTHQWKTPLAQVGSQIFLLEAISKLKKEDLEDELIKILPQMKESILYLNNNINDIYSCYANPMNKETINIKKEIDCILRIISYTFISNNINIIKDIESINFYGYKNALLNVIMILLENCNFQLQKLQNNEKNIYITVKENKSSFHLTIEDNGGGMDENEIDKIFHINYSSKGEKGSGVGLALAKKLVVKKLNGTISVNNGISGLVFNIVLPN